MKSKEQIQAEFDIAAELISRMMTQVPSEITRKVAVLLNAFHEEELPEKYAEVKQEFTSVRRKAN